MHPTVFSCGPLAVRSYGFMLAVGFLFGIVFAAWRARRMGENPDHIYNLSVWLVISSLFGARLYYIIPHYEEFRAEGDHSLIARIAIELRNMFWPVGSDGVVGISGLTLYGGVILATVVAGFYLARHRLSVPLYMDILAPSLGLGEFFTRIGCFLNGCCFGHPTDSWIGIVFSEESAAGFYYPDTPLHPAQLYNSFAGLFIFCALLLLERHKRFNGYTALLYFMLYAVGRFVIDFFRYYESEMLVGPFSQNQVISLVVFAIALSLFAVLTIRARGGRNTEKHAGYKA